MSGSPAARARLPERVDVAILGGGLAGQSLARQLLLETSRSVLLVERLQSLPQKRQKVGESTVQLAGYYFSRVLDCEEHLLRRHFLKYNLRFFWPSDERANTAIEDLSQGFIRDLSNVASYQVDRNALEGELFERNLRDPRFQVALGVRDVKVELGAGAADHRLRFTAAGESVEVAAGWVVDATGRGKLLSKKRELRRPSPIRHGTYFWWVEGLVDIERLTARTPKERRQASYRRKLGHLPMWLGTNHFVGEGYWFWVIPLHGKTSLGLVFDRERVPFAEVSSPEKATEWICQRFPLLRRDLPGRAVLESSGLVDYAHDCAQTISAERWAMTGEAGRFSDPLYSPGSDLIAIHNTLLVDAIESGPDELPAKARAYEQVARAVYNAYVPTYVDGYDTLGDPEAFSLKYTWELAVYFAFYVFPFINDLFTERRFLPSYFRAFARLGPVNAGILRLLLGYYRWRKENVGLPAEPVYFDFNDLGPLARARTTFYRVGVSVEEAREVLAEQMDNLEEMARFLAARVAAVVLEEPAVLRSAAFVERLDPAALDFDPAAMRRLWEESRGCERVQRWRFDPTVVEVFPAARRAEVTS